MTNKNITEPVIKKRKTFTATFDKYDFSGAFGKICFIKVKDDRGNLIKKKLHLTELIAHDLLGNLIMGETEVAFTAELIIDANYVDGGCHLKNIEIIDAAKYGSRPID
jgi:hypothetical protein